jgi:hypothetical protein
VGRYPPEFNPGARTFSWIFQDLPVLCVKWAGAQSFGGAHKGRVCVRVFIGVSVKKTKML